MVNKEEATVSKSRFRAGLDIFCNILKRSTGLKFHLGKFLAQTNHHTPHYQTNRHTPHYHRAQYTCEPSVFETMAEFRASANLNTKRQQFQPRISKHNKKGPRNQTRPSNL